MFKKPSKLPGLPIRLPDPRPLPDRKRRPGSDEVEDKGRNPLLPKRKPRVPFDIGKKRR